jgi:outer membrane protein TolC
MEVDEPMTVKGRISFWALVTLLVMPFLAPSAARAAGAAESASSSSAPATPAYTKLPTHRLQVPSVDINSPIALTGQAIGSQTAPEVTVAPVERKRLEHSKFSYDVLLHQWSPAEEVPPESVISERYIGTRDQTARNMSLKQAIFLALRNNPTVQAARLTPRAALEAVRQSEATFDPTLTSKLDLLKSVTPATSFLSTGGAAAFATKEYDWNFGVNKLLSSTNGTMGLAFNNSRVLTNSTFASVNPSYTPGLTLSLSQPLLQNFGLGFATINLRIAENNQKAAQFTYEQNLSDFVLSVANDYWNVVRAEENLQVAREAYKLAADLVRRNEISVKVGVMAPLDLQEAQSGEASNAAGVYQAENALTIARATLRQDVMLNPSQVFLPERIEPSDRPTGADNVKADEEQSLEYAMEYRPELASMRQMIRSLLLQVKYAEHQTLPQLNVGAQIGLSSTAGNTKCTSPFSFKGPLNCIVAGSRSAVNNGVQLPFKREYGDALDNIWSFGFYNYAVVLSFQRPLMNDAAEAALAQAKIQYEQQRLQYRALISQIVLDVENQLSAVDSGIKTVAADRIASDYARESLRAEQERFRVGMATTHDLLQYQELLVAALGNEVNAEVNLELSKLALRHAQGMILRSFNVNFEPEEPHQGRWYAAF